MISDESSQCTEPSSLVPLTKGIEALLLVGDPRQLPPTVISREAARCGLAFSMFDRFMRAGVKPVRNVQQSNI